MCTECNQPCDAVNDYIYTGEFINALPGTEPIVAVNRTGKLLMKCPECQKEYDGQEVSMPFSVITAQEKEQYERLKSWAKKDVSMLDMVKFDAWLDELEEIMEPK